MAFEKKDKLRETEARKLALQIASTFPNHRASTAEIKKLVPKYRELSAADLSPSLTRENETMWEQIIGNVVSHKKSSVSIFNRGFATRTADGIEVTPKGIAYLKSEGII